MDTHEHESENDSRQGENSTSGRTLASLTLLPSSRLDGNGKTPHERRLPQHELTGIGARPEHQVEDEREERGRDILQVIADVENATQSRATSTERVELADWLVRSSYTLGQIRAAAETIVVTETYGRPLSREFWFKAFAEPIVHPKRIRELCRQAYEKGRKDKRQEIPPEVPGSGIDAVTKRLLEAEKELMTLKEERVELMKRTRELERECRALQRQVGGPPDVCVYRKGDRLIVEHSRKNGEVYYHEQHVDETDIPATRGRRMPEADFDRQIAEQNVRILTDDEIARLPGYDHW